ncbi:MAG TPA: hypothetical protein VGP47_11355 [Parachlamydiaceae bacterium]|nr:hypothetical protein [Parachlamydiaceae bacterium]
MKLGLVAVGKRNIRSGYEYDHLFPKAEMVNRIIIPDGGVKDTVKLMEKIVYATLVDTKEIAKRLQVKGSIYETCKNIFDFVYNHYQYKLDQPGEEQLRRPSRAWADRTTGVDCDCYTLTISSILTNLNIQHRFRITAYEADWQHVYVVVPVGNNLIKIDPVLDKYNYEKPFTKNFDHTMVKLNGLGLPIAYLGSLENDNDSDAIASAQVDGLRGIVEGDDFDTDILEGLGNPGDALLTQMYNHIKSTRDYIEKNQSSVLATGGAKAWLTMLNFALDKWNTPDRDKALDQLEKEENRWNISLENVRGIDGDSAEETSEVIYDEDYNVLGKLNLGGKGKKFFSNVKKSVQAVDKFNKKIVTKVAGQKVTDKLTSIQKKTTAAAKKIGEAIKKFIVLSNPLTLAMRAGFLAAMKINLFGMAQRLYPGTISESEALKMGVSKAMWERSRAGLDKVSGVFQAIGGARSKLEKYIKSGRAAKKFKKLSGLGSLGEPISTAVTVVAAAATLLTAAAKMKSAGVNKRDYDQLAANEAARQKSANKRTLKGYFGEVDEETGEPTDDAAVSETEQIEETSDGSVDESKKGLSKFIAAIKKFFNRKKSAGMEDTSAIVSELQSEAPDASRAPILNADGTPNQAAANGGGEEEASGGFSIMQFVKENPVKVLLGAAAIGTAIYAGVRLAKGGKKKNALAGTRKKKKKSLSGPGKKKKVAVVRLK